MREDELRRLLSGDAHLPNPRLVLVESAYSFPTVTEEEKRRMSAESDLYTRQKAALAEVGRRRFVALVPEVLLFLDYPADHSVSTLVPPEHTYATAAPLAWPAYGTLLEIGVAASPAISHYISNRENDLASRLMSFQVLHQIDAASAEVVGRLFLQEMFRQGQKGAADRISTVLSDNLPFWGPIDFAPIVLSKSEILHLLAPERHLRLLSGAAKDKKSAEYALFLRQKQAIHDAGELKDTAFIPSLLMDLDYTASNRGGFIVPSPVPGLQWQRRTFRALDAILKMGHAAIPVVTAAAQDGTKSDAYRNSATRVSQLLEEDTKLQ